MKTKRAQTTPPANPRRPRVPQRVLDAIDAELASAEASPEWTRESDPAEWPDVVDLVVWTAN